LILVLKIVKFILTNSHCMNIKYKILFRLLLFLGATLFACKKDNNLLEREYPRINTFEVTGISESGATFEAHIYSAGNESIIDHGFVWGTSETALSFENSDRVSLGAFSGIGKYNAQIKSTLQVEKKYFVRSFVKTSDHIVYGPVVSFISLGSQGPIILDFEPQTARWGDTIIIKGSNFCWKNISNKVFFNGESAEVSNEIQYCTDTSLRVTVPYLLNNTKSIISIEIAENKFYFVKDTFELAPPSITDIHPTAGYWGDTITIHGSHLNYFKKIKSNYIKINETLCVADSILLDTKDSIKFKIPCSLSSQNNPTTLNMNGISLNVPKQIQLLQPIIISFSPKNATWGSLLTLYGRFNPMKSYSTVLINNIPATIYYCSKDSIKVKVPYSLNVGLSTITYKSNDFTTSSTEQFQLIPPIISSVIADKKISGSYVTISGNYFNNGTTTVYINDISSYVYSCTSNTIKAKIPQLPNEQLTIKVVVSEQSTIFYSDLSLENPKFTDFSPRSCTFADTIFIYGEFLDKINYIHLIEQYKELRIAFKSPNLIKAPITSSIRNTPATIKLACAYQDYYGANQFYSVQSSEIFTLTTPTITSISPSSGSGEQEIKLIGENFNPDKTYTEVYFGNTKATVLTTSKNEINIKLNKLTNGNFGAKLKMNGFEIISSQTYTCNSPWTEINNLPFEETIIGSFSINNKGYTISYNLYDYKFYLRRFDPEFNNWSLLQMPPKTSYSVTQYTSESFEVGGKIYFLQGSNRVDYFDVETGSWTQANNFPSEYGTFSFSFKINDKFYIINQKDNLKVWEYNSTTNTWSERGNIPESLKSKIFVSSFLRTTSFSINGKGYVIANDNSVWEYTPELDIWTRKNNFPGQAKSNSSTFAFNNKAYVVGGSKTDHTPYDENWEYDFNTDTWVKKTNTPSGSNYDAINFVLNNEVFFGGGNTSWSSYVKNLYKYDPTIEP